MQDIGVHFQLYLSIPLTDVHRDPLPPLSYAILSYHSGYALLPHTSCTRYHRPSFNFPTRYDSGVVLAIIMVTFHFNAYEIT